MINLVKKNETRQNEDQTTFVECAHSSMMIHNRSMFIDVVNMWQSHTYHLGRKCSLIEQL
jgi:hypothetical protein